MSTLGLVDGVKAGFGMMNRVNRQKENDRRFDKTFDHEQNKWLSQENRLNHRQGQLDLDHELNRILKGLQINKAGQEVADMPNKIKERQETHESGVASKKAYNNYMNALGKESELRVEGAKHQNYLNNSVNNLVSALESGQVQPIWDDEQIMSGSVGKLFDPNLVKSLKSIQQSMNSGDWDTTMKQTNLFFKPELNRAKGTKGKNGSPITNVDMVGVTMTSDTEGVLNLQVTTENGEKYFTTATDMASSDPNDPTYKFSFQHFFGQINSLSAIDSMLEAKGMKQQALDKMKGFVDTNMNRGLMGIKYKTNTATAHKLSQPQLLKELAQMSGLDERTVARLYINKKYNGLDQTILKEAFIYASKNREASRDPALHSRIVMDTYHEISKRHNPTYSPSATNRDTGELSLRDDFNNWRESNK